VAVAPCDGICSGDITVIEAKTGKISPELLPFIIQNDRFFDFAIEKSAGSLSPRAKWEHLCDFEINLPPMEEQRRLAEVLWAFDNAKQAYKRLIKLTDDLVKSRFVEMFGDGGFDTKRIGEVVRVRSSKRVYQKEQTNYGVPFLRVSDLTDRITHGVNSCELYITDELYDSFVQSGLVPKTGDILVTSRGTLGLCYIIREADRFYFQDGMISWLDKSDSDVNSIYMTYLFQADIVKKQIAQVSAGSTVAYISLNNLENFEIPLPPLPLQTRFAAFAEAADKSTFAMTRALDELDSAYKALVRERLG
jgi:type I restriction enzyme S subunit